MKYFSFIFITIFIFSCQNHEQKENVKVEIDTDTIIKKEVVLDNRISLGLNPKQKRHQLKNMRSHLKAIQSIIDLIADDDYDEASEVAYEKLGSTTEMKLMCASFGNEQFENLGLEFHKSADEMSEIIKGKDQKQSLKAVSHTMDYCIQCHETFRQ
jgi:hypothetical protein